MGTGFSYTDSDHQHAKSDQQVASDLLIFIEKFLDEFPSFSKVSTYVVGQCYGGKIAVLLAFKWLQVKIFFIIINLIILLFSASVQ